MGIDPTVAPPPPVITEDFRRAMGAELGLCPCEHVLGYIVAMDGYADQMRRFRGE